MALLLGTTGTGAKQRGIVKGKLSNVRKLGHEDGGCMDGWINGYERY
jgi:hypothetical protein